MGEPDMKESIIYKIGGIDADNGVDATEIAAVLFAFSNLVNESRSILDLDLNIDIRVKPFQKGSWKMEFLLHASLIQNLFTTLGSSDYVNLKNLLEWIGILGGGVGSLYGGYRGALDVIKFVKGKVDNYRIKEGDTFEYFNEDGESIMVPVEVHRIIQSEKIQKSVQKSILEPLAGGDSNRTVEIYGEEHHGKFEATQEDILAFSEYSNQQLLDGEIENTSFQRGLVLKPVRGPYGGEPSRYTFSSQGIPMYPVSICDEPFLERIKNHEITLSEGDSLIADVEVITHIAANGSEKSSFKILKVERYTPFKKDEQLSI